MCDNINNKGEKMIEMIMGLAVTQTLILTFLIIWNEFDQ
tara:strand:- start:879 stop:995 length:117 start_codon:yes stop_codon:yes gene_type:complete